MCRDTGGGYLSAMKSHGVMSSSPSPDAVPMSVQLITPVSVCRQSVQLIFGSDQVPGIRRTGTKRFRYVNELTREPPSAADVARIQALAIPPAWTQVWIAADPLSHLQATGRDARGRTQLCAPLTGSQRRVVTRTCPKVDSVADHLGNTRAVCRSSYVHPAVIESYVQATLRPGWHRAVGGKPTGLTVIERTTLRLLRRATAS